MVGRTTSSCLDMMMPCMYKKVFVFDLDDTLYKEIDFLKSAYQEIAGYVERRFGCPNVYHQMNQWYAEGIDVFQTLIDTCHLPVSKDVLITMYREHHPNICLDDDTKETLEILKAECKAIGIITDGRQLSQMNKIYALGLEIYMNIEDIFISEAYGHQKPDEYAFRKIEQQYKDCKYIYVGDNPSKDFLAPNRLGWDTICLLDDGRNIHKQDFDLQADYLPNRYIYRLNEIMNYNDERRNYE